MTLSPVRKNLREEELVLQVKPTNALDEKVVSHSFLTRQFHEFCNRTDLHGFKYMVMEELNGFERACWTVAVFTSIIFAAFLVVTAYNWYARNPIVTVIESTQGAIWDVPFPSVTICDINLVSRKAARKFADKLRLPANITADEVFRTLQFVSMLFLGNYYTPKQMADLHKLQPALDLNNVTTEELFKSIAPAEGSCDKLLHRCMWKNTIYKCGQIFKLIFVENVYCCVFNYFALEFSETQRAIDYVHMKHPRRVASCGSETALIVLINNNISDYYSTILASQGTLVFVDNAYNYPTFESPIRIVNPFTEVRIALSPERTYAISGLKAFNSAQRNCYYSDELKLGKLRKYTFHNCVAYKKAEMMLKSCNCVPINFPFPENHRVCNYYDIECIREVQKSLLDFQNISNGADGRICRPECEHFNYPLEVALGKLSINGKMFSGLPFYHHVDLRNKSLLSVFFNDLVSTRYRRDVYLNWQNILASFGGLLSLMLGFTLISGFDFIIFCTFKPIYYFITCLTNQRESKKNKVKTYDSDFYKYNNWMKNSFYKEKKDSQNSSCIRY